jgi:hypothetical protein
MNDVDLHGKASEPQHQQVLRVRCGAADPKAWSTRRSGHRTSGLSVGAGAQDVLACA